MKVALARRISPTKNEECSVFDPLSGGYCESEESFRKRIEKFRDKLTAWEAGQELVKAHDVLADVAVELKDWPKLQAEIQKARKIIGACFNEHKSHEFGL